MRNRIKGHRRVRASELVPHELNWKRHGQRQRQTLKALYEEVGFARSLLAYELPDGRLKLIDGHLRREVTPDEEIDVEVLDVSDAEARKLLLSMDSLAALAETDVEAIRQLKEATEADHPILEALWSGLAKSQQEAVGELGGPLPEQFLILIECSDQAQQRQLLAKFLGEGLVCRALMS
jgi:hypothetical protein